LASPAAQLAEQLPFEQTVPIPQRLPHMPQLRPSDVRSAQTMPQSVSPGPHWQLPAVHVAPNEH
jgi:hypothetical protein